MPTQHHPRLAPSIRVRVKVRVRLRSIIQDAGRFVYLVWFLRSSAEPPLDNLEPN